MAAGARLITGRKLGYYHIPTKYMTKTPYSQSHDGTKKHELTQHSYSLLGNTRKTATAAAAGLEHWKDSNSSSSSRGRIDCSCTKMQKLKGGEL